MRLQSGPSRGALFHQLHQHASRLAVDICPPPAIHALYCAVYHRTESTIIAPGLVRPLVDPPSVPPTATFRSVKMLWLNGQVSPEGRLPGVTVKNGEEALSTKNCISFCVELRTLARVLSQ